LHVGRVLYPQSDWPELAHLTVTMPTGGLVQGDRTRIHLVAEPRAVAHLSSQSATRVYRCESADVRQQLDIELAENAYVEWWPDLLIPYGGADFIQDARLTVHPGATLLYADSLVAGRLARGEYHAYHHLRFSTLVRRPDGSTLCRDLLDFEPASQSPVQTGLLGRAMAVGTFLVLGADVDVRLESALADALAARFPGEAATTRLPNEAGLLVRVLARSPGTLRQAQALILTLARQQMLGRSAPYDARV
jgi:urease accessory protein